MIAPGIIFDVKHFSLHDGPGIRTTVFLKGCPLRCIWCHNPESFNPQIEEFNGITVGYEITVEALFSELHGDQDFYQSSGGGVTLSGGEPLMQPEFTLALLDALGQAGIHRAVDTCGAVPGDILESAARRAELILYDIKATDDAKHRELTGGHLLMILENLDRLNRIGTPVRLRCPLVPGINDDLAHLEQIGQIAEAAGCIVAVDVLPYHRFGKGKFNLPEPAALRAVHAASGEQISGWIKQIEGHTGKPVRKG
jgi:pyruvate formate lyase activating enzyme